MLKHNYSPKKMFHHLFKGALIRRLEISIERLKYDNMYPMSTKRSLYWLTQVKLTTFDYLIVIIICVYVLAAASVSLNRYWQYDAFWYELGLYSGAIWKVAKFQPPVIEQFEPPKGRIIFADHFNPSLFLFSPIYWFTDRTEALLIAQAVTVGLSAWVAYLTAKKVVKDKLVVLALMTSYLGYVGLQNALYTDFHDTTVATLFVMIVFWSIVSKKWRLYWVFLLISLGFKETMSGLGVGIGLFLILKGQREIKKGILTILISIMWYFVVTKFVIPAFSGGYFSYEPTIPNSIGEAISGFFIPLNLKTRTIFLTFFTFGFAPVFSIATWPIIVEHFAERFVLSQAATRWDLGFHYNALLSPIFLVGTFPFVLWLKKISLPALKIWAIATILVVVYLHRFYLHGPLMLATHPVFYEQTRRNVFLDNFNKKIPRTGLLMTLNNLAAHQSTRPVVLLSLKNFDVIKPDVVALDLREGQNANDFFPATFDEAKKIDAMLQINSAYLKTVVSNDEVIYTRK